MKKNDNKKLCWNCDGCVSLHLTECPYCQADLSRSEEEMKRGGAPREEAIPPPPYAGQYLAKEVDAVHREQEETPEEPSNKRELVAFLLLLPGIAFLLFGAILLLFSKEGHLTLEWKESFSYFYFLGAVPLLFFGWRILR